MTVTGSEQLVSWQTVATPGSYPNPNFNALDGIYTVPETGRYSISATINYQTTAAITLSLGAGVNPAFAVQRITPDPATLVTGLFPILNIQVTLLTLRAVLGNGTVTLAREVELTAGDQIGLFYIANGLTIGLDLGGSGQQGIFWSINQIA
ncbi:hypothetical protein AB4Y30_04225 [Ornithinibacillus sp. 4-3]|uniref:C1q domain-containing protein n=1 Tax=Ornithinibacillus sp. 4-3 TaxID=3231488 RepID=A0AB39HQX7_9BACI